jgi:hypothetical protein
MNLKESFVSALIAVVSSSKLPPEDKDGLG